MDINDLYDTSPEIPTDDIIEIHHDSQKFTKEYLLGRYKYTYNSVMKTENMSSAKAHAIALCVIMEENNYHLLKMMKMDLPD